MERLITAFILFFTLLHPGRAQLVSDETAIITTLQEKRREGEYRWRPKDKELKYLAYQIMANDSIHYTNRGLTSLIRILTGDEYDDLHDSLLLNTMITKIDLDFLFGRTHLVGRHFTRSRYNSTSLQKISRYVHPQNLLRRDWSPYYLTFLNLDGIDTTLLFLKENIDAVNRLHYKLYNTHNKFKPIDIDICLARLGILSDTTVISQLDETINSVSFGSRDYKKYIERLAQLRTPYAFQKIGDLIILDLEGGAEIFKTRTRRMALGMFIVYVKNFPDSSLKIQETINVWNFVEFSRVYGKDYSTDEYMKMAQQWFRDNRDNIVLDYDKY